MASESAAPPINGSYGAGHYNAAELPAHNPAALNGANAQMSANASSAAGSGDGQDSGPTKDEVGWYFVEQYYITLSKNPDKLPLFYNRKSQLVFGNESSRAPVSVGQKAIGERIKELELENCKVRVTNVDSQESHDKSIVIQVIGEMSNKNEPHKKFVQTFVLATQQNGYYVLNDIFRYMAEDDDEEVEEAPLEPEPVASLAPETQIKTLSSSDNLAEQAKTVEMVDQKLERSADSEPAVIAAANGAVPTGSEPVAESASEEAEEADESAAIELELPKDPESTPAPPTPQPEESSAPAPATAKESAAAPQPSAPKTWASMFSGGNKIATPIVPAVPAANASSQPKKAAAPAAAPAAAASAAAPPTSIDTLPTDDQPLPSPGGWQTAGQEHKGKANRGQSNSVSTGNGREGTIKAYIKNVTEKVDGAALRQTLQKYGKLEYFDISRQKNCAFVEFADQASFNAATADNPHNIGGEDVFVEERHIRAGNTYGGFNNRGNMRGRGNMDSRNNSQGGRGGFNKEGRGNFSSRGSRGGAISSRGRGMPQAA